MLSQLLATIAESPTTALGILGACNAAIATALGVIYRDCRKDRAELWAEVRALQRKK